MSETTYNLIQAMANGDALETEQAFGAAMAEKLAVKLDDMRTGIAQSMFNTQEQQETFVEEDFQWITEEEYLQLTEEEQEEYLTEEQLDELMGKGSIGAIRDIHHDAAYNSGKQTARTQFHGTQAARAGHIASKISTRAKYGKDAQHYHEYGYNSKKAKGSYARLSPDAKKKVTKTLGKEYTGKDTSPHIQTKGKTTIDNPHTKAQQHDSAVDRTKTRSEYGLKQLPQDKETIKGGRD
jgi:hypothetical protein